MKRSIIENRPGTSSLIGTQYVGKSTPDGHSKKFLDVGVELTASASAAEFTSSIRAEFDKKARLIKAIGITPSD